MYKFQRLEVYQLALDYLDSVYHLSKQLPDSERFNLRSQLERASTSIALNIAEGSTKSERSRASTIFRLGCPFLFGDCGVLGSGCWSELRFLKRANSGKRAGA